MPVAVVSEVSSISGLCTWCTVTQFSTADRTDGTNTSTPSQAGPGWPSAPPVDTALSTTAMTSSVNTSRQPSQSLVSSRRQYRALSCLIASRSSAAGDTRSPHVAARPGEVVLDRHPALETAVALAVVPEAADRVEDPQRRPHRYRQQPGEDPVAVGAGLRPAVADLQRQLVRQVADVHVPGVGFRPVRRVGDEVIDRLGCLREGRLRTRRPDAQPRCLSPGCPPSFTDHVKSVTHYFWVATRA